jgi:hypothetical protein
MENLFSESHNETEEKKSDLVADIVAKSVLSYLPGTSSITGPQTLYWKEAQNCQIWGSHGDMR